MWMASMRSAGSCDSSSRSASWPNGERHVNRRSAAADAGRSELGMIDEPRREQLVGVWGVDERLALEGGWMEGWEEHKHELYSGKGRNEGA